MNNPPIVFEEFFEQGQEESSSPFLSVRARRWGVNLPVRGALVSAFLLIIAFVLSYHPSLMPLSNLLLVAVYFLAGIRSLIDSIEDLSNLDINIDVLMTLAAFSSVLIGSGMEGALLLVLFSGSAAMEEAVSARAKNALSHLRKLSPSRALVLQSDGSTIERAVTEVNVGEYILIRPSEVVPLDGTVSEGISSVNLVHLTGESVPITKGVGDFVPASANNMEGVLTVKVEHTSGDSTLSRIIQLVTEAQEARPALQRWFDKLSRVYALSIISLAAFFAISFPFLLSLPFLGFEGSLYRALAFLIAASPCALILAIPIAYLSAIGVCAKRGILIKGGVTLDALASCKAVAFDKTGTLTTGELCCLGYEAIETGGGDDSSEAEGLGSEDAVIGLACALERAAVHPVARAILTYGKEKQAPNIGVANTRVLPGQGVVAELEQRGKAKSVFIGRIEYILDSLAEGMRRTVEEKIAAHRTNGELLAALTCGAQLFLFRFTDQLRPHIAETLAALRDTHHLHLVMLTGDHAENARKVADELGITSWKADLRPEDKLHEVARLAKNEGLAMIGDGINDAPALARATVGICMGKVGSTAAIEAADVVLLHDNIELLDWLVAKARKTRTIVKQNLTIAVAAICIAALPALAGLVPLWLAVVLHEGGTVLVGLNALRLLKK